MSQQPREVRAGGVSDQERLAIREHVARLATTWPPMTQEERETVLSILRRPSVRPSR